MTVPGHLRSVGDGETHVVRAVVARLERGDGERSHLEGEFLVYGLVIVLDAARYVVAAQYAREGLRRGPQILAGGASQQRIGEAHVVAVVVREDYALHGPGEVNAVGLQLPVHCLGVHAGVDEHALRRRAYVGPVAAAAAAEAHKHQPLGAPGLRRVHGQRLGLLRLLPAQACHLVGHDVGHAEGVGAFYGVEKAGMRVGDAGCAA